MIRLYLARAIRLIVCILGIFTVSICITIGVMFVYNWYYPVDWSQRTGDVYRLLYNTMSAISMYVLFKCNRS